MSDDRCGGHNHGRPLPKAINCFIRSITRATGSLPEMWSYVTPALLTLFDGRLALFIGTNWTGVEMGPITKATRDLEHYQMSCERVTGEVYLICFNGMRFRRDKSSMFESAIKLN